MRTTIKILIIIIILSGPLFAQTATPKINKIQKHQRHRIVQGIKNRELTKGEINNLEKRQTKIHKDMRIAKSDGIVTKKERKHIRREQIYANKKISYYKKEHC